MYTVQHVYSIHYFKPVLQTLDQKINPDLSLQKETQSLCGRSELKKNFPKKRNLEFVRIRKQQGFKVCSSDFQKHRERM